APEQAPPGEPAPDVRDGTRSRTGQSRGRAPRFEMHLAASALPAARASVGGLPASQGGRKPAVKASPAPVPAATRSTVSAGARMGSARVLVYQSAPSALSLITTWGNQAVRTFAAAVGSSRPVSTLAWSALANSSLAPCVHSRNGSAPVRSMGAAEA